MRFLLLLCLLVPTGFVFSQKAPVFFKPVPESDMALPETAERKLIPLQYQTYLLDYAGIKAALQTAPMEFTEAARKSPCKLAFPMADGTFEEFAVWEISIMEPELAAQVPFIRTYAGASLLDPRKTIRLSYTLHGFSAMIMRPDFGTEFIDPVAKGQDAYYMVYDLRALPAEEWNVDPGDFKIDRSMLDEQPALYTPPVQDRGTQIDPVKLKVYKLIVSTTGEFSQDHGTTPQQVFSAVAEYINKVNAAYERDMAIRFQLVQASLLVMFMDPNSDPFSGGDNGTLAAENQNALAGASVPLSAYDIGHVLNRGGGGVGGLGVICQQGKSRGCSSGSGSYGPTFLFVIGQEIGHQLGGNHTWNRCGGAAGDQRHGSTAYEPGSGSTIMSYAGICGSDNIQGVADLYFHAGSIQEIRTVVDLGSGAQCGSYIQTDNNLPIVTLPYKDNFFIPIGTPFELNGSAIDPDGDPLTYSWEGIDFGPEAPLGEQVASSAIFRTYPAVNETNRYFPQLSTIRNNGTDPREILPAYTRDLTFRFTARDNRAGGGGVAWADLAFKAWGDAGPFRVQSPNATNDVWHVGEYTEVRWDVANSDKAPVNCTHVNIRLSVDAGLTYPIVLASHVLNDGSHYVLVPNNVTPLARVRIDGDDNVFFDISDKNFKIQLPTQPSFTMGLNNDSGILCLPADHTVEIQTAGVQGFSSPASLEIVGGLPANAIAAFSATTLQPGESATLTLDFSQVDVEGVFVITLQATVAGQPPIQRDIVLTTLRNDFSALALNLPPNGATELQLTQTLYWTKALDAQTYDVQFASDPSFEPGTILASANSTTLDSFKLPIFLAKGTPYFWRVRPKNECGAHDWTEPFFFSTFAEKCTVWEAGDLPKNMTSNGTPTIESKITVNAGGLIKSMEVRQLKGYHEFFKDLDVHLISPQGTDLTLWSAKCGNFNGVFNLRLTDEAPGAFPCPPPNNGSASKPANPLSAFTGQNSTGAWTLRIRDTQYGGGGALDAFQLEFCSEVVVNPPYLVNNNPLTIDPGINKALSPDLLLVEDANNTHSQLTFTLLTVPEHGHLELNWAGAMQPGDQFTQADLDNGNLRFFDYGGDYQEDGFRFVVTDGEGGFFGTPKFIIRHPLVGSEEPLAPAFDFRIFPNPAQETVWVSADQPLRETVQVILFNTAGQRIQQAELPAGAASLSLQTGGLPRGLYFVQVQGTVRKLILH